ncbi:MAG: prolipoprotein diacylglyceryl transferase [Actinomycetota bacterium]
MISVIRFHAYPRVGFVSPHGLGIAAGYLAGGMLMVRHAARRGIPADDVWNMLMRGVVGVIVGARIFYVVGHLGDYFGHGNSPIEIFKVWRGGVVFYGGAVGGIIAAIPYIRKHGLRFVTVMDSTAAAFPLGLIFGRIGDIIVGDHLGGASKLPFAFRFYPYRVPLDTSKFVAHAFSPGVDPRPCFVSGCHQTALYDLINVIILFAVVMLLQRKPRARGFLIAFTTTWYGGARLITDFARDAQYYGFGPIKLHGTQWGSIALIIAGVWYLIRISRHGERDEWPGLPSQPSEQTAEPSAPSIVIESSHEETASESTPVADPEHFPTEGT